MNSAIQTETGFVTINGTRLYYTDSNPHHAETMVMVHAGICDHRMWAAQVEHFAQRYRVLTFDMHGFGQSDQPTQSFAFHTDIVALLDERGIDSAWFMAASLGGAVTFDVVLEHPQRVTGLVLIAPAIAGYQYKGDPHPLVEAISEADDAGDLERLSELEIQMWFDGNGRTSWEMDSDIRKLVVEMNLIALQKDDFWDYEEEITPPALARLNEITMPTLLIYGDLDVPASLERVEIIAAKLANVEKVLIPNTAHLPNMEQPDMFHQLVDDFLAKQSS